ncbi:MAG: iron chaperone [Nitrososphaerales archaeon]
MREAAKERNEGAGEGEAAVLAKIAAMKEPDRKMAKRIHEIVKAAAPGLSPRTWYGMPAYSKGDKVICWFQDAGKFKARYSNMAFSDKANLDEGRMWPIAYALKELTPAEEARIAALVKRAVG